MKRPIYLDDRERELARQVFAVADVKIENLRRGGPLEQFAFDWTRKEIGALAAKFVEPEMSINDTGKADE